MFVSGGPQEPCPRGIGWEVGPLPLRNARIFATHRSLQIASHEKSVAFLTERVIPLRLLLLKSKAQLISCADIVQSCNSPRKNGTDTVPTLHCNSVTATKVQHASKWPFSQNRASSQDPGTWEPRQEAARAQFRCDIKCGALQFSQFVTSHLRGVRLLLTWILQACEDPSAGHSSIFVLQVALATYILRWFRKLPSATSPVVRTCRGDVWHAESDCSYCWEE